MKLTNKRTLFAASIGAIAALALTASGIAFAHGGPHGPHGEGGPFGEDRMDAFVAEMIERLDLSPAQEQQIRKIAEDAKSEAAQIKDMPRGKEKLLAFRDLHFATEDQIHATLTCEQREALRHLKREHKVARMQQRFEQRHGSDATE